MSLPLHHDKARLLVDRLRWLYEQRTISLLQAHELCCKLPEIIHFLDELVSIKTAQEKK